MKTNVFINFRIFYSTETAFQNPAHIILLQQNEKSILLAGNGQTQ